MRHRLEATFDQRGIDCIAAAGADPEQTDRLLVDEGQRYKKVDRAANVLDPRRGVFGVARKPLAFPLEGWIENERRVALGGQLLRIKSTGLFFDADAWPYDNDGWILLVLGETVWQPKLTNKLATVAFEGDAPIFDTHPASWPVLFDRIEIWFDRANRTGAAVASHHVVLCCGFSNAGAAISVAASLVDARLAA
jgi:hypothetical protein